MKKIILKKINFSEKEEGYIATNGCKNTIARARTTAFLISCDFPTIKNELPRGRADGYSAPQIANSLSIDNKKLILIRC